MTSKYQLVQDHAKEIEEHSEVHRDHINKINDLTEERNSLDRECQRLRNQIYDHERVSTIEIGKAAVVAIAQALEEVTAELAVKRGISIQDIHRYEEMVTLAHNLRNSVGAPAATAGSPTPSSLDGKAVSLWQLIQS